MILWKMPLPSVLMLMATSIQYEEIGQSHLHHRLTMLIRRFFKNMQQFLDILDETGTVISGSAALWFMMPPDEGGWVPKDLDLYTTSYGYKKLRGHLLKKGFHQMDSVQTKHDNPNYPIMSGMKLVTNFKKMNVSIDVIVSRRTSPFGPIFHFHSTMVMNFISARGFFSAYPRLTEKHRALASPIGYLPSEEPTPKLLKILGKYVDRGFDIRSDPKEWEVEGEGKHMCRRSYDCPETLRSTADTGCLFYMFPYDYNTQVILRGDKIHRNIKDSYTVAWHLGGKESGVKPFVAGVGLGA